MPECRKPCIEGKRKQETEDHLDTDRSDSKLLQQLDQIAVVALGLGLSRALGSDHGTGSPRCRNASHDPGLPTRGRANQQPGRDNHLTSPVRLRHTAHKYCNAMGGETDAGDRLHHRPSQMTPSSRSVTGTGPSMTARQPLMI